MMADRRPTAAAYADHRRAAARQHLPSKSPAPEETRPRESIDGDLHLKAELLLIRDTIARNKRDLGALIGSGDERPWRARPTNSAPPSTAWSRRP